jgi:RimJ/RimL family protein N-acetyltransferase
MRSTVTVVLNGPNIRLRPVSGEDVKARLSLGNHVEIFELFGVSRSDVAPATKESAERWVRKLVDHAHAWGIEFEGRLVGEIRLDNVNPYDRRATMAIGILDPSLLGKGLGSEAIGLLLAHAFMELGLHRIAIRVLARNRRAIRAYEKCGFLVEGQEREAAFVNGDWHDDVIMGLLAREFRPPIPLQRSS